MKGCGRTNPRVTCAASASNLRRAEGKPCRPLYGDFFVKWKSARLSLFGMGRGSARGPLLAVEVLAARTVDGPNPCQGRSRRRRWPKASLYKGWVHRRQSGAEFTPASGLAFRPILRAEAKAGERPSASVEAPWGMRFLCGFSTGWRLTMTFGAAKAIMGSARLGFEGNYTAGAKIIAPQPCIRWVLQPEP